MATSKRAFSASKTHIFLLVLSAVVSFAASSRILDELPPPDVATGPAALPSGPAAGAATGPVGPAAGAATGPDGSAAADTDANVGAATGPTGPVAGAATGPVGSGAADTEPVGPAAGVAPGPGGSGAADADVDAGAATGPAGPVAGAATGPIGSGAGAGAAGGGAGAGAGAGMDGHPTMIFFMHDILGGSNPTAKAVTGIVANPAVSGQIPFAKPNGAVLPSSNGIPQNNDNSGIINNNNLPFLVGLSGTTQNVMQNANNNGGNTIFGGTAGFPVVNGAQLQSGTSLQKLMFGTLTAIDDELTEGPEPGSGTVGKAQGLYVASSVDGTSQVMALTVMFESGGYEDSLVFFGVHRTVVSQSQLAVMGGTGKFTNAKGFATIKLLPAAQHQLTDGFETVVEFAVYLTY